MAFLCQLSMGFTVKNKVMAKVFLSHSSKDKTLVREIAKKLGQSSIIDEFSFEVGNKTLDEIFRTMNISDIFVLSVASTCLLK